jgi:acetyl-CoA carboxylase biotin carboxylase subunit
MIRISAGEQLGYRQKDITFRGHAIECRISAENPEKGFLPGAGTVKGLFLPGGNGVRVDSMLYAGCQIPPFYDSMLAKVITHGNTREEAVQKMRSALGEFVIEGIQTNLDFQYDLIGTQLSWMEIRRRSMRFWKRGAGKRAERLF